MRRIPLPLFQPRCNSFAGFAVACNAVAVLGELSCLRGEIPSAELAGYSGIGINKLREITNERGCNFVLFVGTKRMIKRRLLDAYLEKRDTL